MLTARCTRYLKHQSLFRFSEHFSSILSHFSTEHEISTFDTETKKKSDNINELIIFNTVLERQNLKLGYSKNQAIKSKMKRLEKKSKEEEINTKAVTSVALKYLSEEQKEIFLKNSNMERPKPLNDAEISSTIISSNELIEDEFVSEKEFGHPEAPREKITEEEHFEISEIPDFLKSPEGEEEDDIIDPMQIGTYDPNIAPSTTPCGGCGAIIHCQDPGKPGFIPKEMFEGIPAKYLRAMICQRCHYLKHYNTALDVVVSPDEYPKILGQIRKKKALVLLVVDLMDFPCSIWPRLSEFIGTNRSVCVVGNKVDLLPADSSNYLDRVAKCLKEEVKKATGLTDSSVKHVALVSAKTGYGIEELINKIHSKWEYKGDVYLVGCTNVGKSTLFNALIQSDLCKVKAVDLMQRATISPWPGTTLNLLKFPMLRPERWRLYLRTKRLKKEQDSIAALKKLQQKDLRDTKKLEHSTLKGHVGRTFQPIVEEVQDSFSLHVGVAKDFDPGVGLDPKDPQFREGHWCYDTPGTFQLDQLVHLLTEEELDVVLPDRIISPQTLRMKPGQSLFIAGLGRLDYVQGEKPALMTVFTSHHLPLTMCSIEDAPTLYSRLLGSELLVVPCGDSKRLSSWPGLEAGPVISLTGQGWFESCADILLSTAGWVSITTQEEMPCVLQAHTPNKRGIYVRQPSLLPFAVNRKGTKVRYSPAYRKYRPLLK